VVIQWVARTSAEWRFRWVAADTGETSSAEEIDWPAPRSAIGRLAFIRVPDAPMIGILQQAHEGRPKIAAPTEKAPLLCSLVSNRRTPCVDRRCGFGSSAVRNVIRIRLGHDDVTLTYLKCKDAESEDAQEHTNSSSLALYAQGGNAPVKPQPERRSKELRPMTWCRPVRTDSAAVCAEQKPISGW
jgi:hypothetical protein